MNKPPEVIYFNKWSGKDGISQFIENHTGCKPFSGSGINIRYNKKTAILRSVDGTNYYKDNLNNVNRIEYTLFGNIGDQNEEEPRFNEPLLNKKKIKYIYLYRVQPYAKNKKYIWYGKYKIIYKRKEQHIDKHKQIRTIIILTMEKISI